MCNFDVSWKYISQRRREDGNMWIPRPKLEEKPTVTIRTSESGSLDVSLRRGRSVIVKTNVLM